MYNIGSTGRYEIPTSEIERSRQYGSGVYPDYSIGYPVQRNIVSASASVSLGQRNQSNIRQASSASRYSVTANLSIIVSEQSTAVTELPSSSMGTQPLVPSKLNLRTVLSNLNTKDPFQAFILEPKTSEIEDAMYNAIACKDLPLSVKEKQLDWPSEQARNLLGILSQDVLPEDRIRLKNSFAMLQKVQHDSNKEPALAKDISFLLHKYGKTALYRHIEAYTECCRKVWHYYHPGHTTNPPDDVIFTADAELCYRTIASLVNQLTLPNITWTEIVCNGLYFKDTCGALGIAIKIDPQVWVSSESITETFDSVYLNDTGSSTNLNAQNDYEIINADGPDPKTIWEQIACILCCEM